ncbi:hypothetical protein MTR67_012658, partial [Solanum verrucosum]
MEGGDFSYSMSGRHGRSQFRQRFSGPNLSSALVQKFGKDKMPTPRTQGACFGCGKTGHIFRDFHSYARKAQPRASSGSGGNPLQNRFYALQTRQNHEGSPNMVTDVCLVDSEDGSIIVKNGLELSLVSDVKAKHLDPTMIELKKQFLKKPLRVSPKGEM